MSTLQECIDLYHARQAARMLHLTGSGVATIPGSGPSGDEPGACAQTATSLPASTFGELLHLYRKQGGVTQATLSRDIRASQSYLCKLERGALTPTARVIFRIADALNLEPDRRAALLTAGGYGRAFGVAS